MSEKPKNQRTPVDELAREAAEWDSGNRTPAGWRDAPEAIPDEARSQAISLRIPSDLLLILKEFARRDGVGYQVLIKRWLDERVQAERDRSTDPRAESGTGKRF